MKTLRPNPEYDWKHDIDVYFKYKWLDTSDLLTILSNFNTLYGKILDFTSPVYMNRDIAFRNFMEVSSIHTGDSIHFKLKEGWKPEFEISNGDLNVYCPKNLGIPVIMLFLLLTGIEKAIGIYNQHLDTDIKHLEIQLKKLELQKKIEERKAVSGTRSLTIQVNKTVRNIIKNRMINYIEINGHKIPLENNDEN